MHASRSSFLAALALSAAACAHSQSAPTPAVGTGVGTVMPPSSMASTAGPWSNAAPTVPSSSVESLTDPMDAAMLLCTRVLNYQPCGLITTGMSDMLGCFAACKTQIQTVTAFGVERAAIACASSPPPEGDAPRECTLPFPPGAALDLEDLGKKCGARCKEIADALQKSAAQ